MKVTPVIIIDVIFSAFISFILSFVILYYYLERAIAITLAAVIAALFALLVFKRLIDKNEGAKIKKADKAARNTMVMQLNLCTDAEQCSLFEKALKNCGYGVEKKRGGLFIKNKNSVIFPKFGFDGVTKTDIVKIFNTIKNDDIAYILSEDFSAEIKAFADRFDGRIKTVIADPVYNFLNENECLPKSKFVFPEKKPLKLSALKNIFQKKKAKNLLGFGLIFLAMSYFVPIKTYYVICGSVFLFFALISRLYGKTQPLTE